MQIDETLLTKLEKLSFLKIEEEKREEVEKELTGILDFMENLNSVNTDGLSDKFFMAENSAFLREDEKVQNREISNTILENAPHREDDFFIVPKIIE
jgi:aspartyl-tRNA(Asn)/glutamyl-tRNA(Gln) amidotransferase subunit C